MKMTFAISILLLILCSAVNAHLPIFSDKAAVDPESSVIIDQPDISQVIYRQITEDIPQVWLGFDAEKDFKLFVQIGIPVLKRLENFRPAIAVIGPGLPRDDIQFDIPKNTGMIFFNTENIKESRFFHEHFTGTDSWILQSKTVQLPQDGRYYVVAFVPSEKTGKLWLSIGKNEKFSMSDWAKFNQWKQKIRKFHEVSPDGGISIPLVSQLTSLYETGRKKARARINFPAPLFADTHYHGSCDPEIIWNTHEKQWQIFYTARRAKRKTATYVGTPIGIAVSKDLVNWHFKGYCSFDGIQGNPDMPVTFWAPGIIRSNDTYHMFVTCKDNANPPWAGSGNIVHYTAAADDLLNGWKKADIPKLSDNDPIDATLIKVDDHYNMYYRVGKGGGIQWATSKDLTSWNLKGKCPGDINAPPGIRGFDYQEAPYVFKYQNKYWMLTDPHKGLAVYVSDDAVTWQLQGLILAEPGTRKHDNTLARHPSVAVIDNRAFLFYHVEPWRPYPSPPAEKRTIQQKQSFLQAAELKIINGKLTCNRNK